MVDNYILAGADIDIKDKHGLTYIHYAAMNGHEDVVNSLIEKGVNIDVKNKYNYTPLHCVVMNTIYLTNIEISQNIIDILVKNKADVNSVDKDGNTPLHHAAIIGDIDIIKTLMKHGANPLLKNIYNETPKDLCDDSDHHSLFNKPKRTLPQESLMNTSQHL